jgi:hypothetical protein
VDEPADRNGAFPRLDDEQRARLRAAGEVRAVRSGEVLFRDGDAGYDFFVVESARSRSSRDTDARTAWSRSTDRTAFSASSGSIKRVVSAVGEVRWPCGSSTSA